MDADEVPDDLPELGADLVAALARLHVHDLPHSKDGVEGWKRKVLQRTADLVETSCTLQA